MNRQANQKVNCGETGKLTNALGKIKQEGE